MADSPRDSPVDDASVGDDSDDQSDEWRFSVDDVGEDAADVTPDEPRELPPIEPGSPSLENALFVLLGVVGTLLVFLSV
ncbi:hypothetical protein SAMN04487949_0817 [Halogranum gelatinilyticum]|uniref:DUF7312 domain-containing protein n=1 Tax=Halogranum gelatinilyticum TaxID=660521 RepID=A0A1G9QED0_9EURY|nr:hypothetical protein [Halogranum gelatinilyticum]SDM09250.1 hypothetical protein SAMN04487949_0817 [Halogranum gelatinilyticum]